MKVKVSEATGQVLNWLVMLARGGAAVTLDEDRWIVRDGIADMPLHAFTPSTDWSQGGPIIEWEEIEWCIHNNEGGTPVVWKAWPYADIGAEGFGPTTLIAAMRCYVTARLGDEVDVPEELI